MKRELFNKIQEEVSLTAEETLYLDAELESERGRVVRETVLKMQDSEPSLSWRSALNQRLIAHGRVQRRNSFVRFGSFVTAGAAAVFVVLSLVPQESRTEAPPRLVVSDAGSESSVEDMILVEHEQVMTQVNLGVFIPERDVFSGY